MWDSIETQLNALMHDFPEIPEGRGGRTDLIEAIHTFKMGLERIAERAEMPNFADVEAELDGLRVGVGSITDPNLKAEVELLILRVGQGIRHRNSGTMRMAATMARDITNRCSENGWHHCRRTINGIDVELEAFVASYFG